MSDRYASFSQLSLAEPEGAYKIELRQTGSAVAFLAPHAGEIEPGTSEICRSAAGDDLTYYLFEGCKPQNNSDLHITSSSFDEPQGLAAAQSAQVVATFHGQSGSEFFVNVGGLATDLGQTVIDLLTNAGYTASRQNNVALRGLNKRNICNRGKTGQGLQLEISRGLRNQLVADKDEMDRFSAIIRSALHQHGL